MLKKFITYYQPHKYLFLSVLIVGALNSTIDLIIPRFTSYMIDDIIIQNDFNLLLTLALVMLGMYLLKVAAVYYTTFYGHMVGTKIECTMRSKLYEKMQSLPVSFFDNEKIGKLMSRLTTDLNQVAEVCHHGPENVVTITMLLVGSTTMMYMMNVKLALVVTVLIPIVFIVVKLTSKIFFKNHLRLKQKIAEINGQAEESFAGIRVVKAFANEDEEVNNFEKNNQGFFEAKRIIYRFMALWLASFRGIFGFMNFVVIIYGGFLVMNGELLIGNFMAFYMYVNLFIRPIDMLSDLTQQYNDAMSGFSRYLEIQNLTSEALNENGVILNDLKGEIEFKNVTFGYKPEHMIFKNFSLKIYPGETIALVGPSGVGKTTICNLLTKFYDIQEGQILIDGVDINDLNLHHLRKHIGIVQQDVYIFGGTVKDNIKYGNLEASDIEVLEASKNAQIDEFVGKLDHGFDTYIGEKGVKLSGGQKQRLSIARNFLKNPEILILDEATSALDNRTERQIQDTLMQLTENRTCIIVAHRLSTIKNANRIIVLDENGIVESGNHETLMKLKGSYYNLHQIALSI